MVILITIRRTTPGVAESEQGNDSSDAGRATLPTPKEMTMKRFTNPSLPGHLSWALVASLAVVGSHAEARTVRLLIDDPRTTPSLEPAVDGISADGRYVLFESDRSDLVLGDTNGTRDVFLRDRLAGTTTRVSVGANSQQGNAASGIAALSPDGRHVAFTSIATNLVLNDTNGYRDVFVRDVDSGVTERVSFASDGNQGNGDSGVSRYSYAARSLALSAGGRYVSFPTYATNFRPTSDPFSVCVHDRVTHTTRALGTCTTPPCGNSGYGTDMSADGRWILFETALPGSGHALLVNLFLFDRETGSVTALVSDSSLSLVSKATISADGRYVAYVSSDRAFVLDRVTGVPTLASVDPSGNPLSSLVRQAALSPDGRFLFFVAPLASPSGGFAPTLLRRDLVVGNTVSLDITGSYLSEVYVSSGALAIAFESGVALVAEDVHPGGDLYAGDFAMLRAVVPAAGPEAGGEAATLLGDWLITRPADVTVRFGGVDAIVTGSSATQVGVLTPPGTGTVDVTLSTGIDTTTLPGAYTYRSPEITARYGNVNGARGVREDVLFVNSLAGDPTTRELNLAPTQPIEISLVSPSSRVTSRYVLYAWSGLPNAATLTIVPRGIGSIVLPTPFTGGARQPFVVWNVFGHARALGLPTYPSAPASTTLLSLASAAPSGVRFTLQGLIEDDGAANASRVSVTNAVLVRVGS
ncbi:MAG: IPT/TIG domain-containing protein [Planctomycetes bacterium]|nr:IPT/TIG domain-containing protein [Planctomycetota bacterium]